MKAIRFDRKGESPRPAAKVPASPPLREPLARRIVQLAFVFLVVFLGGYWLLKLALFRSYRGIVVGDQTEIAAIEPGRVGEVFVRDHRPFHAGRTLLRIESPLLRLRRESLEREIQLLETGKDAVTSEDLDSLRGELAAAEASAAVAAAEREEAEQRRKGAAEIDERTRDLFAQGAVTVSTVDARRRELREADLRLAAAEQGLVRARSELETERARLQRALQSGSRGQREAEQRLARSRAELREVEERERKLEISGLRNGVVSRVHRLVGDEIQPGDPLLTLVYEGSLWIEAYVDPEDLPRVGLDAEVTIKTGKPLEIPLRGRVISVGPSTRPVPLSHRDRQERLEHFAVVRIGIELERAVAAGLLAGQVVTVQAPRW